MYLRAFILFWIILTGSVAAVAGSAPPRRSGTVKKERTETNRKILKTREQLNTNLEKTRHELNRLSLIESRIVDGEEKIKDLRGKSDSLRCVTTSLTDSITILETQVQRLKESYADVLRAMRRQRQLSSDVSFIFTSASVSQAKARVRYLRELSESQREKAAELAASISSLNNARTRLVSSQARLDNSISLIQRQQQALDDDQRRANDLIESLKRQGKNLEKVLKEQEERARRLDRELEKLLEEESRAAAEAASRDTCVAKPRPGASFADSKGSLPRPVSSDAIVVSTFGRHTHNKYEKIQVQNDGIDFETVKGDKARAVYPGVVSLVIVMDGYHNVVILRHGNYLTVYAGIDRPEVRKGQTVQAGQSLGTIFTDEADSGRTRLHFEVRNEKEKLDPSEWIK